MYVRSLLLAATLLAVIGRMTRLVAAAKVLSRI